MNKMEMCIQLAAVLGFSEEQVVTAARDLFVIDVQKEFNLLAAKQPLDRPFTLTMMRQERALGQIKPVYVFRLEYPNVQSKPMLVHLRNVEMEYDTPSEGWTVTMKSNIDPNTNHTVPDFIGLVTKSDIGQHTTYKVPDLNGSEVFAKIIYDFLVHNKKVGEM